MVSLPRSTTIAEKDSCTAVCAVAKPPCIYAMQPVYKVLPGHQDHIREQRRPRIEIAVMLSVILTIAACAARGLASADAAKSSPLTAPLRFRSDGTFQLAVFEDLHFGENYWDTWGPEQDVNSVKVMNEVLDKESPQLVLLNGDLITGENAFPWNSTAVINKIAGPLVKRGLPWASTYGNHDSQFNLSRADILKAEHNYTNARTQNMLPDDKYGITNYYLPVYPSNGSSVPSLLLWFFDSRGGFYYNVTDAQGSTIGQPDWVDQHVVDWFTKTSSSLNKQYGKTIPSLGFVHIPTNASVALQEIAGVNSHHQPGINDDYVLAGQAQGWCEDNVSNGTCAYGGQDVPFMEAITSTPRMLALFSGHDHGDTWCYKWDASLLPKLEVKGNGINLCFGQHSGYGGYGTWTRGSRQIVVHESKLIEDSISTYIRLETGDVVGAVELNSTYNHDYYPATPNTHSSCMQCNYTIVTPHP